MTTPSEKDLAGLSTYQAGLLQARALRSLSAALTTWLSAYEISIAEWTLLALVVTQSERTPSELAADLGITRPMCTKLLTRLEDRDLIRRRRIEHDRRSSLVELSSSGYSFADTVEADLRTKLREFLVDVPREQLEAYFRVLRILAAK